MKHSEDFHCDVAIVGGGASGYFTAGNLSQFVPGLSVCLFEASSKPLAKVAISGGGRCNVTHGEFDVNRLVEHYPRGFRELRGPFSRFQPKDMIRWLEDRGVKTKTEADGRVFPCSDDSQTIIKCLMQACDKGVETRMRSRLIEASPIEAGEGFHLRFKNGESWKCRALVLATGSHVSGLSIASALGHTIIEPTPSLFTFNIVDDRLKGLEGLSFEEVCITLKCGKRKFSQTGPLLITHWGLSGPAVLKLSAWASKELAASKYKGELSIDFSPRQDGTSVAQELEQLRQHQGSKQIENTGLHCFPKRYWQRLIELQELKGLKIAQVKKANWVDLQEQVKVARFAFEGKSTFKSEFVTAGGVKTSEVQMKTMESKLVPNLYFTGELLNIDGVTGGFNFQHAWTSGFICASAILGKSL